MEDPVFYSNLSDEERQKNFSNVNIVDGIIAGLEEAIAYQKGESIDTANTLRSSNSGEKDQ